MPVRSEMEFTFILLSRYAFIDESGPFTNRSYDLCIRSKYLTPKRGLVTLHESDLHLRGQINFIQSKRIQNAHRFLSRQPILKSSGLYVPAIYRCATDGVSNKLGAILRLVIAQLQKLTNR